MAGFQKRYSLPFRHAKILLDSRLNDKTNILFVVHNIFGFSGDAVNERQLAKALLKRSTLTTYSLVPVLKLAVLADRKHFSKVREETNISFLFPVISLPYSVSIFSSLLGGLILAIIATFRKPQLVYVRSSMLALPFLLLKRFHKARVIVKVPALLEDELEFEGLFKFINFDIKIFKKLINIFDRYILTKSDIIVAHSPLLYAELIRRRRVKGSHSFVLTPPGIDIKKIDKIQRITKRFYEYKEDDSTILIGFIGTLIWWQGVDVLARAVHILQNIKKYKFKLIIVGDGPLRKTVVSLCRQLGVECVVTGYVSHEEALNMLATFDVLVVPRKRISSTECNIPIKIIEAWALGIPVVATNHKVFQYFGLRDGEDLVYCDTTPESVAEAILKTVEDIDLRQKLRYKGPSIAKKFSYDNIAERLLRKALS